MWVNLIIEIQKIKKENIVLFSAIFGEIEQRTLLLL